MKYKLIELFRIIAIFGVVYLHLKNDTQLATKIGYIFNNISVPFFYSVSIFFFISKLHKNSFEDIFKNSFNKLLKPYIIWTVFYSTIIILVGSKGKLDFFGTIFYGKSAVQLYFIPTLVWIQFLIFFSYSIYVVKDRILPSIIGLFSCLVYCFYGYTNQAYGIRKLGLIFGLIILIITISFISNYPNKIRNNVFLPLGLFVFAASVCMQLNDFSLILIDFNCNYFLGGFGLFLIGISTNSTFIGDELMLTFSKEIFGIYLIHVFFVEIFERIFKNFHYTLNGKIGASLIILIFSFFSIKVLRSLKVFNFLF